MQPKALMKKIVDCNKCIEKIQFTDKFMYYDMILSEENQKMILDKLAAIHLERFGNSKTYENYGKKEDGDIL